MREAVVISQFFPLYWSPRKGLQDNNNARRTNGKNLLYIFLPLLLCLHHKFCIHSFFIISYSSRSAYIATNKPAYFFNSTRFLRITFFSHSRIDFVASILCTFFVISWVSKIPRWTKQLRPIETFVQKKALLKVSAKNLIWMVKKQHAWAEHSVLTYITHHGRS